MCPVHLAVGLTRCKLGRGDVKSCRFWGRDGWPVNSRSARDCTCSPKCRLRLYSTGRWDWRALPRPLCVFVSQILVSILEQISRTFRVFLNCSLVIFRLEELVPCSLASLRINFGRWRHSVWRGRRTALVVAIGAVRRSLVNGLLRESTWGPP